MQARPLDDARPDPGLPMPSYWRERLAGAEAASAPVGGGRGLRTAAAGYCERRGQPTDPERLLLAPGAEALLLALLVATGGDVVAARPSAGRHSAVPRLLGRTVHHTGTPAEGGGAPDPFALLETISRARDLGGDPRLLILSAADDPTGTVTPPEPLHEVCEAAAGAGLLIVSDETYSDVLHHSRPEVLISPAEMLPDSVVVLADLGASLVPPDWPAALARFPATDAGTALREGTRDALADLRAVLPGPVAAATAYVLTEPAEVRAHTAAANRLHAAVTAAAYRAVTGAGALCRPPEAGFHLYPDLSPHRPDPDSVALEARLTARLGRPVPGGHRFGDDPAALHVRIDTGPLHGRTEGERRAALDAPDPLQVPRVAAALSDLRAAFTELAADR